MQAIRAFALLATAALPAAAFAQDAPETPAPSPAASVMARVGLTDITVDYSAPGVKGRPIWGKLVPYNELWRTGANKATQIRFSRDVEIGGKAVPAGAYSLFTIPTASSWTVIINKNTELWGTNGYDEKEDVVRTTVKPVAIPARERLTFIFSDSDDDGTRLDIEWEKVRVSLPIKVATKAQVTKSIETTLADVWRPHARSAKYLLDTDGDLKTALAYADTSIGIKGTWYNYWVKAQILGKMGNKKDAAAAAEKALSLGDKSGAFAFYSGQMKDALKKWK
ncbi:MAG: DUF2911 domain-containing protein [Deltaproteobacteria bacterium]|nr:DUF2911 domain-containing protein [Deltaproteobacteria bacterium]